MKSFMQVGSKTDHLCKRNHPLLGMRTKTPTLAGTTTFLLSLKEASGDRYRTPGRQSLRSPGLDYWWPYEARTSDTRLLSSLPLSQQPLDMPTPDFLILERAQKVLLKPHLIFVVFSSSTFILLGFTQIFHGTTQSTFDAHLSHKDCALIACYLIRL